jgi:hypothetical protein
VIELNTDHFIPEGTISEGFFFLHKINIAALIILLDFIVLLSFEVSRFRITKPLILQGKRKGNEN